MFIREILEGTMSSARKHSTDPKFTGYWKGKDPKTPGTKMVGGSAEESVDNPSILRRPDVVKEYGGVGGYGAAPQSPQGTNTTPDPKQQQAQADVKQMAKSLNLIKPTVAGVAGGQSLNTAQAITPLAKSASNPGTDLNNQDLTKLEPMTKVLPDILKNPQTAGQFKQLMTKAQQADQATQAKIKAQQQPVGTNQPANTQQQQKNQQQQPGQVK